FKPAQWDVRLFRPRQRYSQRTNAPSIGSRLHFRIAEYMLIYRRLSDLMAKPKSEDKRNAILSAAAQVFAERGLGAPTAAITKAAGIAEGSLFTYFKTKDELINALYRELKLELAD